MKAVSGCCLSALSINRKGTGQKTSEMSGSECKWSGKVVNEQQVLWAENTNGNYSLLRPKVKRVLPPPAVVTR